MAEQIYMIALSPTMEEGKITIWRKTTGDAVKTGDVICDVETDKATMEYESSQTGTILAIVKDEGSKAKVGEVIGVIGKPGEDFSGLVKPLAPQLVEKRMPEVLPQSPSPQAAAASNPQAAAVPTETSVQSTGGERSTLPGAIPKSSPLARKRALEQGIDLRMLRGTGPGGRVIERDVLAALNAPPTPSAGATGHGMALAPSRMEEVSGKRAVISKRLSESMFSAPHYFLKRAVDMENLLHARERNNKALGKKLSLNAWFMKLAASVLVRHPVINAAWKQSHIEFFGTVDIALAVALPDGLITPVVRSVEQKSIEAIDRELGVLIEKSRAGTLQPHEYTGAGFTISNLGNYGVDEFTAIINPPGSAILALGAAKKRFVPDENENPVVRRMMTITLSCDHRVIDGAVGAAFLAELSENFEDPVRALI